MDTRTGEIVPMSKVMLMGMEEKKYFKEMLSEPTPQQLKRIPPKVGRNDPCPCNSGKKFKKCCLNYI